MAKKATAKAKKKAAPKAKKALRKTIAKKKVAKKKASKKTAAKKAVAKKAAPKKAAAKKTAAKKSAASKAAPAKKKVSAKKSAARKAAVKKAAAKEASAPKVAKKKASAKKVATAKQAPAENEKGTEILKETIRKIKKAPSETPAVFKPGKKHTPVVFSMDEVRDFLKTRKEKADTEKEAARAEAAAKKKVEATIDEQEPPKNRKLGAASIADILGFNPATTRNSDELDLQKIDKKYHQNYHQLVELRNHVREGLSLHSESRKEEDADRSRYGKDMADAGTDNFDKDFALSLVSGEQEALAEIEAALDRMRKGTYGVCEITGKPIDAERLAAVPFARFSVEGQAEYEQTNRRALSRGGFVYADSDDDAPALTDDSSDD